MQAVPQKDAGYKLVAKALPQFPPRLKANPGRKTVQVASSLVTFSN
jgi:hypothetical protein